MNNKEPRRVVEQLALTGRTSFFVVTRVRDRFDNEYLEPLEHQVAADLCIRVYRFIGSELPLLYQTAIDAGRVAAEMMRRRPDLLIGIVSDAGKTIDAAYSDEDE
jgi:hypothetical protein